MTCRLIALASLKGGCGKSTLALNLAAGLARRGGTLGLLDADPQGALQHWAAWGPEQGLPQVLAGGTDPVAALAQAAQQFDTVVVDCPPSLDMVITGAILEHVDMVLIPVLPSALDLWAGAGTAEAVAEARKRNPALGAWMLLNQMEPRSALSRAMTQALSGLTIPTLENRVRRRAAFRLAAVEGVSVYQLGARGREAAREIDQVIEEALQT